MIKWILTFTLASFVWILVTLITDWNSVFYRKAIIYKKAVEDELRSRRDSSSLLSFKSSAMSSTNNLLLGTQISAKQDQNVDGKPRLAPNAVQSDT